MLKIMDFKQKNYFVMKTIKTLKFYRICRYNTMISHETILHIKMLLGVKVQAYLDVF
jgi:hypothetical protein